MKIQLMAWFDFEQRCAGNLHIKYLQVFHTDSQNIHD